MCFLRPEGIITKANNRNYIEIKLSDQWVFKEIKKKIKLFFKQMKRNSISKTVAHSKSSINRNSQAILCQSTSVSLGYLLLMYPQESAAGNRLGIWAPPQTRIECQAPILSLAHCTHLGQTADARYVFLLSLCQAAFQVKINLQKLKRKDEQNQKLFLEIKKIDEPLSTLTKKSTTAELIPRKTGTITGQ